ncbi:hypothetical protein A0G02_04565 [Pectobacterium peruviense]|uniref:Uncharacterized protein n=1 Tax=Pectobacterium peruviense TaxID=2066479 RepID=A0ABX4S1E5_9GAMM|nr:hypothetical protein G033_08655 [Pectobacterium peruviense]PKX81436.1 hypothetical protein A0G02_04565 [Pectobacterium peruviense]PKX84310.1 hypothetical protein A0G03_03880 [Pectobacterium peruviense]
MKRVSPERKTEILAKLLPRQTFLTVRLASADFDMAMIWCSVDRALRIAISPEGHNQYVGRSLKVNGSVYRDTYNLSI